jgi:hypothetical protein
MGFHVVKLVDSLSPIIITGGLVPRGEYDNGTAYSVGDSVSYGNSSYVCISASTGNLPTNTTYWQLLAEGDANYEQSFTSASTVTVTHNLGKKPAVHIQDSTGDEVEGDVHHDSNNQLTITFSAAFTGKVVCN